MLRTLPTLLFLASFANVANGQSAAERCAEALLRGDQTAAVTAATSASDPAVRARLQAALLPPSQRPAGMLAVATRYPNSSQTDLAILAGAASLLVLRDGGRALPELAAWNAFEEHDESPWEDLPWPVLATLWQTLERRRTSGGDLAILAEAEQLLLRCSVSRFGFDPARIAPNATWSLPRRREDLLLRAWQRQPGRSGWHELLQRGPADFEFSLPRADTTAIPALPPGDWLLELASKNTRWRGIRAVEVSDLDVVALLEGDRLALAAWRNGALVPNAHWWFRRDDQQDASGSLDRGVAMLSDPSFGSGGEVFVQAGGQRALVPMTNGYRENGVADRWQVHMMVDRAIHRPGDAIQGRVVVRETTYQGERLDAIAHSAAFANRAIELRVFAGEEQVRLAGQTDAHGVYSFKVAVPETAAGGNVPISLHVPEDAATAPTSAITTSPRDAIYEGFPCRVAEFHRPPVLLDTVGPRTLPPGVDTTVQLRAAWASGAPSASMHVHAKLRVWNRHGVRFEESHQLTTDASGLATLSLPLAAHKATYVRVDFRVATPSGPKSLTHRIAVRAPKQGTSTPGALSRGNPPKVTAPELAIVGQPCAIRVRGAANQQVLLVVDRGERSQPHAVQLDEHGGAVVTIIPARNAWPALDLCVASASGSSQLRVPMLLRAARTLETTLPAAAAPGASVPCRIATGSPNSVVTIAVVDERIFAIAEDRTPEPNKALRPTVARPWWRHAASATAISPAHLLDSLLVDGRVPPSDRDGAVSAGIGFPGGAGPSSSAPGKLRSQFRATAVFRTALSDANGVAQFALQLPDDLTTWRVSIVSVAPDGSACQERRQLVTRTPLSAEPVLPRVMRVGDVVTVPIAVDRKPGVGGGAMVKVSASCADDTATVTNGKQELIVARGAAASAHVTLRGVAAGDAMLALSASVGDHEDRSRRKLPVRPDAILRPVSAATMAAGKVSVQHPEGTESADGFELTVLGGSSAAWSEIERRLSTYPYGCVEQTLAKLLPFFAATRAARVHGTAPPVAHEEFSRRLRSGLRRMRQLQTVRGGAFAFWPGEKADLNMTVLVMHGLAIMRAGGLDPAQFGVDCDPQRAEFADAIARLKARDGRAAQADELLEVELAAACLRLHPDATDARTALVAAIDTEQPLPAGLLLRAGLALANNDASRAQTCLLRAGSNDSNIAPASSLPGDNPLATRALLLELRCLLQPDAIPAELTANVLIACLNGYSSTYAQACALSALALAVPQSDSNGFTVQLHAGATKRELTLSPRNRFTARVQLAGPTQASIVGPDNQQLIVRAVAQRREPGSQHAAWSNPIVVERSLCRRDANATKKQRRNNQDLVPIQAGPIRIGPIRVGEVVWLRLRVRSPQPMRYVVIDCPLPAGLEPAQDLPWLERFDDRLALSCSKIGANPRQFCIPLVPTLSGTFVWPPTTAAPMYADGSDGGTAGSELTVLPAAQTGAHPARVMCCVEHPRAVRREANPPSKRSRFRRAMSALEDAFDDYDGSHGEPLRAAVLAATQACSVACDPDAVPDYVLEELTDTIASWRQHLARDVTTDSLRGERMAAWHELVREQQRRTLQVIDGFERRAAHEHDAGAIDRLIAALLAWPDRAMREPVMARVLEMALARHAVPDEVLEEFGGEVADDNLRAVLTTMLASHTQDQGQQILRLLPMDDLRGIAPTLLLQAARDDWPSWLVDVLLTSQLGRFELARLLQDPEFVAAHIDALRTKLPEPYWRAMPLPVFATLDAHDLDGTALITKLASSTITTAELQRELQVTKDVQWQATLAKALVRRGVRELGSKVPSSNDQIELWQRALAIQPDDGDSAFQLLTEARDEIGLDPICEFAQGIVLRHGSPAQLATIFSDLDEQQVAEALEHRGPPAIQALLARVADAFHPLPVAHEEADCAALWRYAGRLQEHDDVLATLCRSEVGLRFANRQIAATKNPELQESLLYELRSLRGLNTETGLPYPDEPWLPMLHDVAQRGIQPTWTAAQRQGYDRIRRLRGVR